MAIFDHDDTGYQAVVSLVGGGGFTMTWQVEWYDYETGLNSYWWGTYDECMKEAQRPQPTDPEWVDTCSKDDGSPGYSEACGYWN